MRELYGRIWTDGYSPTIDVEYDTGIVTITVTDVNGTTSYEINLSEASISDRSIGHEKLKLETITADELADGAVTADKIGSGAVTEGKIGTGAVTEAKIGTGAVSETKLGAGAVTENKIDDGAVTANKIGNGAVTEDKIDTGAVTENKIGSGAVSTVKIEDGAVTDAKLANAKADLDTNSKVKAEQASASIIEVTANRTLALTDAGKFLYVNSTSNLTMTIPANASVAFPTGTEIEFCRYNTGTVTFAAASGVTLSSVDSVKTISDRYGCVALKKISTNVWILSGALG